MAASFRPTTAIFFVDGEPIRADHGRSPTDGDHDAAGTPPNRGENARPSVAEEPIRLENGRSVVDGDPLPVDGERFPATVASAAASAAPSTAPAVAMTPIGALERLFAAPKASADWFAPAFLAQVPTSKIDELLAQLRATLGAFKKARAAEDHFVVELAHGALRADVVLDEGGRFTGLLVRPLASTLASLDDAVAALTKLGGKIGVLVTTDGADAAAVGADTPLATGSTFKLAALAALRADIDAKRRAWTDVVKLDARQKSLPSGTLQDWPDGAPLTVYSLAARMISQSDNTATDTLIRAIGREKIEPFAGRNVPYLTTREMFELKSPEGADVLAKFRAGDVTAKRAVLKELASRPLPALKTYPKTPTALDVEWYFSPRELCALMKRVHDLPLMGINPGVATRDDWSSVAYKGGSEPGVLSMTTWVEKGGHAHCVSASWNRDEKLDEGAFSLAYGTVLAWLAAH